MYKSILKMSYNIVIFIGEQILIGLSIIHPLQTSTEMMRLRD